MTTLSCTNCHGTITRDLDIESSAPVLITIKMSMKCPHCKTPQRVEIRTRLERDVSINGRPLAPEKETADLAVRTL